MASYTDYPTTDSRHYTGEIHERLQDLTGHMREQINKVNDPQAMALLETSAEVLEGLSTAFRHYETRSESAWQSG